MLERVSKTFLNFCIVHTHVAMCFSSFMEGKGLRGRWWEVWGVIIVGVSCWCFKKLFE